MSLCYTCNNAHLVVFPVRRKTGDPTMNTQVKTCVCTIHPEIYKIAEARVPANHDIVRTEGFATVLECNKYEEGSMAFEFVPVVVEDLEPIGNTYIDATEMSIKDQWELIHMLLEKHGFTIANRKLV